MTLRVRGKWIVPNCFSGIVRSQLLQTKADYDKMWNVCFMDMDL